MLGWATTVICMSPASVSSSSAPTPTPATATQSGWSASLMRMLPGIALSFVAVGLALLINHFVPALSVMLVAIILGVFLRNIAQLPAVLDPGLVFTSKRLLRAGVVLLGLQLVVADIVALGAGMIGVVVAVVVLGIVSTLLVGRALHLSITQTLLIAGGFSICGAAAVAAVDGVIEAQIAKRLSPPLRRSSFLARC